MVAELTESCAAGFVANFWQGRKNGYPRTVMRRVPRRDPVLVACSSPCRHRRMKGGLQQEHTPLIAGQHLPQRIRNENGTGKTSRIRPDWKLKTLPKNGGKLGRRSLYIGIQILIQILKVRQNKPKLGVMQPVAPAVTAPHAQPSRPRAGDVPFRWLSLCQR
jgi:hypothetical protein